MSCCISANKYFFFKTTTTTAVAAATVPPSQNKKFKTAIKNRIIIFRQFYLVMCVLNTPCTATVRSIHWHYTSKILSLSLLFLLLGRFFLLLFNCSPNKPNKIRAFFSIQIQISSSQFNNIIHEHDVASVVIWICVVLFVYYSRRAQWCFPPIKFKFLCTTNYFWFDAVLILWVDLRFIFIFLKCNIIVVVVFVIVILFVVVVVVIYVVGSLFLSHFTFIAISFLCII